MRKHFYELSPTCYKISVAKERMKRHLKNRMTKEKVAKTFRSDKLEHIIKSHTSLIVRRLHGVDLSLQENKKINIALTCQKINGIIINPDEIFSFWQTVGNPTAQNGYVEGLVIQKNQVSSGIGGGLCQMGNLIHYMVLHSPLKVTELHHHSDALFPDERRRVPFGTGTSVFYNYIDYCFKNTMKKPVQLCVWIEGEELCGELRCTESLPYYYKLVEENHHFRREGEKFYRISQVYRIKKDRQSGKELEKELILDNHSEVMYDYGLIPKEQIRDSFS